MIRENGKEKPESVRIFLFPRQTLTHTRPSTTAAIRRMERLVRAFSNRTVMEFCRFGIVGTLGFIVDAISVHALRTDLGLYGAGSAAYFIAATVTWAANRYWTFRHAERVPAHTQWLRFLFANLTGFIINRGVYSLLIWRIPLCEEYPIIAIAAGSLAGMILNFNLSRSLVFRKPKNA